MAHEEDFDENEETNEQPLGQERTWMHPSELPPNYSTKKPESKIKKFSNLAVVVVAIITALFLGVQKPLSKKHLGLPPRGVYFTNTLKETTALKTSVSKIKKTLVSIKCQTPLGTKYGYGVIIRSDGIILTTSTILKKSKKIIVTTSNGISAPATLLGTSPSQNISLIKVSIANLQATDFSSIGSIKNKQKVLVNLLPNKTVIGNISTTRPHPQIQQFIGPPKSFTTPLQGSLLLDTKGYLLAILGNKNSSTSHTIINVKTIRNAINKIFKKANIQRGWLGVKIQDIDKGSHPVGIVIQKVNPTSPAAHAGIVPLEIITSINGYKITSIHSLIYSLNFHLPGQSIMVGVRNKDKTQLLKIKLINAP